MKNLLIILLAHVAFLATGCTQTEQNETSIQDNSPKKTSKSKNYFTQYKNKKAFSQPIEGLNYDEEDRFALGKNFFTIPWVEAPSVTTARDGLGPLFSANTCIHCHPNNGAGVAVHADGTMTRSHLLRLSHKSATSTALLKKNGFEADSTYGAQLSKHATLNTPREGDVQVTYTETSYIYPDGTQYSLRKPNYTVTNMGYGAFDKETIFAPRIGSALVGLGLLEAISEKDILSYADINDSNHDGISGKANYAYDPESNTMKLGRFTWKASATTVKHQSAAAAHNDMGLSNPLYPQHNCTSKQKICQEEAQKAIHTFDLPRQRLDAIAFYISNLAVPLQREPQKHYEGKELFTQLNCTSCHVDKYETTTGVTIEPYSDLLLHDMGDGLADGRSEFLATGNEWRTAPLWGMGLYAKVSGEANYLHDGRARSIEEAILWHGGEAEKSKNGFMALDKVSREKVLAFLKSI